MKRGGAESVQHYDKKKRMVNNENQDEMQDFTLEEWTKLIRDNEASKKTSGAGEPVKHTRLKSEVPEWLQMEMKHSKNEIIAADTDKWVLSQETFHPLNRSDSAWDKRRPKDSVEKIFEATWGNQPDELEYLLMNGYDPNTRNASWCTPLHCACECGVLKCVEILIKHGADIDAEGGTECWTGLHWAATNGHVEVVKYLLKQKADPLHEDIWGNKAGNKFDSDVPLKIQNQLQRTLAGARERRRIMQFKKRNLQEQETPTNSNLLLYELNSMNGKEPQKPIKTSYQPNEIKKIWIHGAIVLALALLVYFIIEGISRKIVYLSAENPEQLKEVFYGNETWVVLCHNESTPLPPVFQNAYKEISKDNIRFGVLNCAQRLPSGKTTFSRLNLNPHITPTAFITSPNAQPYQIKPKSMNSVTDLVKRIRSALDPKTHPITSSKSMRDQCTSKQLCSLIMKEQEVVDAELQASVKALKLKYRASVAFASLDASKYKLELNPALERGFGEDRFFLFKRNDNGSKPLMIEYKDSFELESMDKFLEDVIANRTQLKPLRRSPAIKEWGAGKRPPFKERPKPKEDVPLQPKEPRGRSRNARQQAPPVTSDPPEPQPEKEDSKAYTEEDIERMKKERREREATRREQLEKELEDFISAVDEHEEINDSEEDEIEEISLD